MIKEYFGIYFSHNNKVFNYMVKYGMDMPVCSCFRMLQPTSSCSKLTTVIDIFSALCAKLFQNGGKFLSIFFLLSAHFKKLLYIEGNKFKG